MTHPLAQKVNEKRGALVRLKQSYADAELAVIACKHSIDVAEAELSAYETALTYLDPKAAPLKLTRTRAVSPMAQGTWAKVLVSLDKSGLKQFRYNDILTKAHEMGLSPQKGNVRALMMNLVKDGRCQRIEDGVFALTEKGRERLGIANPSYLFDEDEA